MADRILRRFPHNLSPNAVEFPNMEADNGQPVGGKKVFDGPSKEYVEQKGTTLPLLQIGTLKIESSHILSLHIFQDELLPRISVTFLDKDGILTSSGYPISNIILSVVIQSPVKQLAGQATDFLIENITPHSTSGSREIIYTMAGELHIPNINGTVSRAISKKTSINALQEIAKTLKAGFADNQTEGTNDEMTWLLPQHSYKDAIKAISSAAYKDEQQFFDAFFDRHYHLTFVNVEKMFGTDEFVDDGYLAQTQGTYPKTRREVSKDDTGPKDDETVPIILTNKDTQRNTEFFIKEYGIVSNHGEVLKNYSLRRFANWYDHGANADPNTEDNVNFASHYHEPLTTKAGQDGKSPQTVELDEFSKAESVVKQWVGINYGNAHKTYKYSQLINHHNKVETSKNMLKVKMEGFNVNVIRGSRVTVKIYIPRLDASEVNAHRNDPDADNTRINQISPGANSLANQPNASVLDAALSDFYYVKSIKHSYVAGKFETEMMLSRRHWLLPNAKNDTKQ